eukprot:1490976-Amphidinium_carterae.1
MSRTDRTREKRWAISGSGWGFSQTLLVSLLRTSTQGHAAGVQSLQYTSPTYDVRVAQAANINLCEATVPQRLSLQRCKLASVC